MTRSHIIANSFGKQFPPAPNTLRKIAFYRDPETGKRTPTAHHDNRDPLQEQVKQLCGPCNRDFMGALESEVMPTVVGLVNGDPLTLTAEGATAFATWASLVAMLRERQESGFYSITSEHAHYLRKHRTPPPGTSVWLGQCETEPPVRSRHVRWQLYLDDLLVLWHQTTYWWGQMCFTVVGASVEDFGNTVWWDPPPLLAKNMQLLWPTPQPTAVLGDHVMMRAVAQAVALCVPRNMGLNNEEWLLDEGGI